MSVDLRLGDCLEIMPTLEVQSVDAILTDLPYGTTACAWDSVIPFEPMWREVRRVLRTRGVFVTTASQPFTSALVMSNLPMFRYEIIWDKVTPTGFLNCEKVPMKSHENILVFYQEQPTFNPQKVKKPYRGSRTGEGFTQQGQSYRAGVYGSLIHGSGYRSEYSYPKSVWEFPTGNGHIKSHYQHPTQKPVALYEYLMRTYTNKDDMVLDVCAGSGTTGVACVRAGRNFIGIEKDAGYFAIMEKRIAEAQMQLALPMVTE